MAQLPPTHSPCSHITMKGVSMVFPTRLASLDTTIPFSHCHWATAEPMWNFKDKRLPSFSQLRCWPSVEDSARAGQSLRRRSLSFWTTTWKAVCSPGPPAVDFSKRETRVSVSSHCENCSLSAMVRHESYGEGSVSGNTEWAPVLAVYSFPLPAAIACIHGICKADLHTRKEAGRLRELLHLDF